MQSRDEALLEKLQHDIAELKVLDYENTTVEDNIEHLDNLGKLLKHVVKDPTKLDATLDAQTLADCWHAIARLLISNTMPNDFMTNEKSSAQLRKHWHSFFGDANWTPIIKNNLVAELRQNKELKALLAQKKNKNNTFFIAMQTQKHLTSIKPHLSSTRHGGAVAWVMQITDELPNNASFSLQPNDHLLSEAPDKQFIFHPGNNEDEAHNEDISRRIIDFIEPYLNKGKLDIEGQPMRPDLFELIIRLTNGNLSFKMQAHVVSVFIDEMKKQCPEQSDQAKIYHKLLADVRNLAENKAKHHASLPLFKYTLPLTAFALASVKNIKITDLYLDWYTKRENKQHLLHVIQKHLDVFAPLLSTREKTALDTIIDHQKSKFNTLFLDSTSKSRHALNRILTEYKEAKIPLANKRPT